MVYHRSSEDSSQEDGEPKNIFRNDGSFLEMFKRMQETSASSSSSLSSSSSSSNLSPVSSTSSLPSVKDITSISDSVKTDSKERSQSTENEVIGMPAAVMASKKSEAVLETAPYDPRFPNTNQTKYCFQSYVDFYRCKKIKGEGYEPCNYFLQVSKSLCPNEWVEKWNSQVEEGNFPGNI